MSTSALSRPAIVEVPAFKLFRSEVERVTRLSRNAVRITFAGPELSGMTSGGFDQRVKLLLPLPGQDEPCLPEDERTFPALRALPEGVRPLMRTYTVRQHRPARGEFDIDFVLHGDSGPGSAFAGNACVGDKVGVFAPNIEYRHGPRLGGVEYNLDLLRERTFIVGDETAIPAIGSILEALPSRVHASVYIELPDESDALVFDTSATAAVNWVRREAGELPGTALCRAVRAAALPGAGWYAWVAGESGMVKAVRRHLVRERGFDRKAVTFMGYWRHGKSEDAPVESIAD